jgi:DNA-binding transcriptional regulator YdaS (Cro superfamily)
MNKPLPSLDVLKNVVIYNNETGFFSLTTNAGNKDSIRISTRGVSVTISNETYFGHRIAWKLCNGVDPGGIIDHIDGNTLNNRIANLRDVTAQENCKNRSRSVNNTTGCTGVVKRKNDFVSQINLNGKPITIGIYKDIESAVKARKEAENKYGYHKNHDRETRYVNLQLHDDVKIIDAIGGTYAVAKICKVTAQAVTQWKRNGIPKPRKMLLEIVCQNIVDNTESKIETLPDVAHIKPPTHKLAERIDGKLMTKNELISELGTPADLARAAGVSPQAVSQWAGESMIPLASAIRVAQAMGRRFHDLRPDVFTDDDQVRAGIESAAVGAA